MAARIGIVVQCKNEIPVKEFCYKLADSLHCDVVEIRTIEDGGNNFVYGLGFLTEEDNAAATLKRMKSSVPLHWDIYDESIRMI